MKLETCLHVFFDRYLARTCGVSPHTIQSYRDTFMLFMRYAAKCHTVKTKSLTIKHLDVNSILGFLEHLETQRKNDIRTRNLRLATFKSFAKMLRIFYPECSKLATRIQSIPQKRTARPLFGYITQQEAQQVFNAVDLKTKEGFRDYTLVHLMYNSGARASEVAALTLDCFSPENNTLGIIGKGRRFRTVQLWPKSVKLLAEYISKYRKKPKLSHHHQLFVNQRGEAFTRHGINRICKKLLNKTLDQKRLKDLNPAHCFRHSCAMYLLATGSSITDIKNHLGHENLQSTMVYLHLNLNVRKEVQKKFIEYTSSVITPDPKLDGLLDWENRASTQKWLDEI